MKMPLLTQPRGLKGKWGNLQGPDLPGKGLTSFSPDLEGVEKEHSSFQLGGGKTNNKNHFPT